MKKYCIMIDGVFNHCSTNLLHGWMFWRRVQLQIFNLFMINKWPFDKEEHSTKSGSFYSFAFKMPKLNVNNSEVIKYLLGCGILQKL